MWWWQVRQVLFGALNPCVIPAGCTFSLPQPDCNILRSVQDPGPAHSTPGGRQGEWNRPPAPLQYDGCENQWRKGKIEGGETWEEEGGIGGGIRSWTEAERAGERERESVYLSSSSPDSDREQTAEDNEKQICGEERRREGRVKKKEGRGGDERKEEWGKGKKKKREREEEERGEARKQWQPKRRGGGVMCSSPQEIDPLMWTNWQLTSQARRRPCQPAYNGRV